MTNGHWFLHADLDAFFASVEQLDHEEYRGKPVIVGGLPTDPRSVVSTASYEARKYGVHSAMPTSKAYKLCPDGIFVHGNMKRYEELSYKIMKIFSRFSPNVQQMSIDEAFIDLTGTERLFGPPEETAMKIKKAVKDETGLTVSIGLSQYKYFAKISSGLSKPNGFYFMKPGAESDFMLNQPIEKIWGIGEKTAKRIYDSGIRTTRQLYEKNLDVLMFMYGENTGKFLYEILRGNADGMFENETKSHSLSNERTFPVDITDIYTNETALMELAHSVMFRLLRDNLSSKTIFIKIRYEDFTTVSIRQTYSNDILTLDSLYEKVKELFEKKYEYGRGVRLLGVGFDNVKTEPSIYQQELFDNGEKKKQAVEQAILNIEKKFPDVQVRKARVINKNKFLPLVLLALSLLFNSPKVFAERKNKEVKSDGAGTLLVETPFIAPLPGESPETLFDLDINDSTVEFLASGYWNALFTGNMTMAFNNGQPLSISFGVPVFKQEIDLETWIMINKKWYFEADFADEFKKNTIALGYNGNGLIKSALLSNRNIIYPSYYSSTVFSFNPGGGENQSPGFGMHLETEKLFADFMIRYDMQKTRSATFYGYNSVVDTEISLSDYISGRFFVIPSGYISSVKDVYVETENGNYTDSSGRKFKKLSSSQFFILSGKSTLILSDDSNSTKKNGTIPSVIVTFKNPTDTDNFILSLGSYQDENSFLGKIHSFFNSEISSDRKKIELSDYAYGRTNDSLKTKIDGEEGIILQSPNGFSPFLVASNYDLGLQGQAETYIYSKSNEKPNTDFFLEETRDTLLFSEPDFFKEKHSYGTVFSKQNSMSSLDFENDVSLRFPLGAKNPMLYLNSSSESDLCILLRLYSPSSSIQIEAGVSAGCVRVYKNGTLDSGAVYNSVTGVVTLSSPVTDTDKIYITWNTEADDVLNGRITAGAGFGYIISPLLKFDADITTSWPLSPYLKYADATEMKNGYAALSGGIYFEKNNFKISDAISFSLESENVTGKTIALESSSKIPQTFYLSNNDGYESSAVPNLNTGRLSGEPVLLIENKTDCGILKGMTDTNISGYKIPLEIDFTKIDSASVAWTSADIKLSNGNLLQKGEYFSIALMTENLSEDYDVYIQLGNFASDDKISISESLLPTWKISETSFDTIDRLELGNGKDRTWQKVKIKLTEGDRARFQTYHDARLIVVSKTGTQRKSKGVLYAGPYETITKSFETYSSSKTNITSSQVLDGTAPSVKKFSKTYGNVNHVEWESDSSATEYIAGFGNFFSKTDYSNYEKICFDYKLYDKSGKNSGISSNCNTFSFILDSASSSITESGIPSLKLEIDRKIVEKTDTPLGANWHSFEINVIEKKVFIDGQEISSDKYNLYINSSVVPSAMKIEVKEMENGVFEFDTLYFDKISPTMKGQNYFAASYKKDGTIFAVNDFELLSDFELNANSKQAVSFNTASNKNTSALFQGFIESKVEAATIQIKADASMSSSNKKIIDSAGHSISTTKPILGVISLNENFRFNSIDASTEKKDSATISFSRFKIPLNITGNVYAKDSVISNVQNINTNLSLTPKYISFNAGAKLNQKINVLKMPEKINRTDNYFSSYGTSTLSQFSSGDEKAAYRNNELSASLTGKIPFANLTPKADYFLTGEYKSLSETTFTGIEKLNISIPFKIKKQSFNITLSKQGTKISPTIQGGNYKSDFEKTFRSLSDMDYFFEAFYFYDLFSKNLREKISQKKSETNAVNMNYLTNYKITWNRNLFNSINDLYVPVNAGFEISRDIKATDTISDIYQYKFNIGNSFINLFGSDSKKKVFSWYKQDEFTSSAECSLKIPYDDISKFTFALSLYSQLVFYIDNSNSLKAAGDLMIETSGNLSLRNTVIYAYSGKKSPLLSLFNLIYKGDKKLDEKISRKEVFNMELNFAGTNSFQRFEFVHSCDINFLKNYSITSGLNASYTHQKSNYNTIVFGATLGGRLEF